MYGGTSGHEDGGDDSEDEGVKELVSSMRGLMTAWRPDRPRNSTQPQKYRIVQVVPATFHHAVSQGKEVYA
jgi:hypothetical protein